MPLAMAVPSILVAVMTAWLLEKYLGLWPLMDGGAVNWRARSGDDVVRCGAKLNLPRDTGLREKE